MATSARPTVKETETYVFPNVYLTASQWQTYFMGSQTSKTTVLVYQYRLSGKRPKCGVSTSNDIPALHAEEVMLQKLQQERKERKKELEKKLKWYQEKLTMVEGDPELLNYESLEDEVEQMLLELESLEEELEGKKTELKDLLEEGVQEEIEEDDEDYEEGDDRWSLVQYTKVRANSECQQQLEELKEEIEELKEEQTKCADENYLRGKLAECERKLDREGVKELAMWMNNSPCNKEDNVHDCAGKLLEFVKENPNIKVVIYCAYKYGSGTGLQGLIREGVTISPIPSQDRDHILANAMESYRVRMTKDAEKAERAIYKIKLQAQTGGETERGGGEGVWRRVSQLQLTGGRI